MHLAYLAAISIETQLFISRNSSHS